MEEKKDVCNVCQKDIQDGEINHYKDYVLCPNCHKKVIYKTKIKILMKRKTLIKIIIGMLIIIQLLVVFRLWQNKQKIEEVASIENTAWEKMSDIEEIVIDEEELFDIVQSKYDEVGSFSEGLAWVKVKDKYGFIDKEGNEVIEIKYESKSYCSKEGLINIRLNRKSGLIDKKGNEVTEIKYDDFYPLIEGWYWHDYHNSEGPIVVSVNGKYGVMDREGNEITELKYDNIRYVFRRLG